MHFFITSNSWIGVDLNAYVDSNLHDSPLLLLEQEVPKLVKSLNKQLREKSIKTKVKTDDSLCNIVY